MRRLLQHEESIEVALVESILNNSIFLKLCFGMKLCLLRADFTGSRQQFVSVKLQEPVQTLRPILHTHRNFAFSLKLSIKSTGGASGYLKYIATRERVEIIPDDRPPTRKQEQLITKLVKDFPEVKELYEYGDYMDKPTKANASAFITLALESNWDSVMQSERYMKYIATRPRAERLGEHGLFGDSDGIDLDAAMNELENYAGNVWTHIISLKRKDAARLGFDNAAAWRDLLRAHRNDIAAAMKIPSNDFRWYAAFHDEGEHPHVHMMAWSAKPGQAYLSKDGIRQIKSTLTNHIFQNEMLHVRLHESTAKAVRNQAPIDTEPVR